MRIALHFGSSPDPLFAIMQERDFRYNARSNFAVRLSGYYATHELQLLEQVREPKTPVPRDPSLGPKTPDAARA